MTTDTEKLSDIKAELDSIKNEIDFINFCFEYPESLKKEQLEKLMHKQTIYTMKYLVESTKQQIEEREKIMVTLDKCIALAEEMKNGFVRDNNSET